MPRTYAQKTGDLTLDGEFVATGYSGHADGVNNPAAQDQVKVGPLPQGRYTIGEALNPPDKLGPLALPLKPDRANEMFGRNAFFIHGDNPDHNRTASDGCIILEHAIRQRIASSDDKALGVVSGIGEAGTGV